MMKQFMRCYNLFPSYFKDIDDMTRHLEEIRGLGFNVVWINPIQLAGEAVMTKSNAITGCGEELTRSLYAMKDPLMIDPRFSVVKRDSEDNAVFTSEQFEYLSKKDFGELNFNLLKDRYIDKDIKKQLQILNKDKNLYEEKSKQLSDMLKNEARVNKYIKFAEEKLSENEIKTISDRMKTEKYNIGGEKKTFKEIWREYTKLKTLDKENQNGDPKQTELQGIVNRILNIKGSLEQFKEKILKAKEDMDFANNKYQASEKQYKDLQLLKEQCCYFLNEAALKKFTDTAKKMGMTPIFDLVLNHVAKSFILFKDDKEKKEFFSKDDTFKDARSFIYSYLLDSQEIEVKKEIIEEKIPKIINRLWDPLIKTYIVKYGFSGIRVDCVGKVPYEVRKPLYDKIKRLVNDRNKEQNKNEEVFILEEALFSDMPPEKFVEKVKDAGATHITGSAYYYANEEEEMPFYSYAEFFKRKMAKVGLINFTGNHDHYPCAMTVCRELAFKRLEENESLYECYKKLIDDKEIEKGRKLGKDREKLSDAEMESIKSIFIHHYVREIIKELNDPEHYVSQIDEFGKKYRTKLVINMLAGSGGYYMLSGDQMASFRQPSVFMRPNGAAVFPDTQLPILDPQSNYYKEEVNEVLTEVAKRKIKENQDYNKIYEELVKNDKENSSIILSAFKEQVINEINGAPFVDGLVDISNKKYVKTAEQLIKENYYQDKKDEYLKANEKVKRTILLGIISRVREDIYLEIIKEGSTAIKYFLESLDDPVKTKYEFYHKMSVKLQNNFLLKNKEQIFPQPIIDTWQVPWGLGKYNDKGFLQEINNIFSLLPAAEKTYWVEIFRIKNKNVIAIVKRNGEKFSGETNIILVNINPNCEITINYGDIHDLAVSMQKRCNLIQYSKEWNECYFSIMGNAQEKERKLANLYKAGKLRYDEEVKRIFPIKDTIVFKVENAIFSSERSKTLTPMHEASRSQSSSSFSHSSTKGQESIHYDKKDKNRKSSS